MTNFDDIIELEKRREYRVDSPDLLAFATLTQIAHEQARAQIRRRFMFGLFFCVVCAVLLFQFLALSQFTFISLTKTVSQFLIDYPMVITFANLGLIGLILLARRLRFF